MGEAVNPAQKLLRWFATEHISDPEVRAIIDSFGALARTVADRTVGTEGTTAVRKLIEAKDAAVRDYIQGKDSPE